MLYNQLAPLLPLVQKPARYSGGEMNMVVKDPTAMRVRFCFCFPDTYEVGMSHLGLRILYDVLNREPDTYCERAFAPWVDMEALMRREGIPLWSLETFTPLGLFDILGFTLQYEMSYTNVLNMLALANVPLWAAERGEDAPLVVCGGPCAFNPEPLADFVDVFLIGDGETAILDCTRAVGRWKGTGRSKEDLLLELANIPGTYVPRFYAAETDANGDFVGLRPLRGDVPARIVKRLELDLDGAAFPEKPLVPFTEIVFDRVNLEVARGCTRGCRFCQAGVLYRPQRERSLETLVKQAASLLGASGYEEISLGALSTGDYSNLPALCRAIMDNHGCDKVSLSLPSLRVDSVLGDTLAQTAQVRKSSLTFAPEAGSQRLRDAINKGVTEADLLSSVRDAFLAGYSAVKLYFMIGLPTETLEDLDGIAALAKAVVGEYYALPKEKRPKGLRVSVSASSFVPKPFTPFQWEPQNSIQTLSEKQKYLREKCKMRFVDFHWHEPHLSYLEAAFARGDRRLAPVLHKAWVLGCRFDGWSDCFHFDTWMQVFADCGLDCAQFAHKAFALDAPLPWDFIDCGVTKAFLQSEHRKAQTGELSPDCRLGCHGCGVQALCGGRCPVCV